MILKLTRARDSIGNYSQDCRKLTRDQEKKLARSWYKKIMLVDAVQGLVNGKYKRKKDVPVDEWDYGKQKIFGNKKIGTGQ